MADNTRRASTLGVEVEYHTEAPESLKVGRWVSGLGAETEYDGDDFQHRVSSLGAEVEHDTEPPQPLLPGQQVSTLGVDVEVANWADNSRLVGMLGAETEYIEDFEHRVSTLGALAEWDTVPPEPLLAGEQVSTLGVEVEWVVTGFRIKPPRSTHIWLVERDETDRAILRNAR